MGEMNFIEKAIAWLAASWRQLRCKHRFEAWKDGPGECCWACGKFRD